MDGQFTLIVSLNFVSIWLIWLMDTIGSEYQHLFETVADQSLPDPAVQLVATADCRLVQLFEGVLLYLGLLQLHAVQVLRLGQVGYHKLVSYLVFLVLVGVDQHSGVEGAHCAGDQKIPHGYAGVDQGQADTVHHCTLCTALVLQDSDQDLNLVLAIGISDDDPLKALPDVFDEVIELSVLLDFPFL